MRMTAGLLKMADRAVEVRRLSAGRYREAFALHDIGHGLAGIGCRRAAKDVSNRALLSA